MSEAFLSRWSRLKAEKKVEAESPLPSPPPAEPAEGETAEPIPELPPIETLTKDSDFSAFLQAGVPDALRKAALAKLWASDPLFSKPEIYDLHMEDYNQPALTEAVKTAWEFGKGMVERVEQAKLPETPDAPEEDQHLNSES